MINDYFIYIILAITVTALPGPAVVLTIKNSMKYGFTMAIANIAGNFLAMVLLAIVSAVGLGAVILASSTLFTSLKIAGCIYLIYLGVMAWKSSPVNDNEPEEQSYRKHKKIFSVFKEGFGVGITNPKAIAFFTALFPQFIDPDMAYIPQFLTLILTIEGISFIVLSMYAIAASYASRYLAQEKSMSIFNKLTGVAFTGFGLALLEN